MTDQLDSIFVALENRPRLLMQAALRPIQTDRFQPTGFPNLGPAEYKRLDAKGESTPMLLVESAQSMANRMERVCWDDATNGVQPVLKGLPYVEVDLGEDGRTTSLQEPHRLASLYILNSSRTGSNEKFHKLISKEAKLKKESSIDGGKLAGTVFKYDPNSLMHGVFFARSDMAGGRARLQRLLSSFIEASEILTATSGGTLTQYLDPTGADALNRFSGTGQSKEETTSITKGLETTKNVPFSRTEYTAKEITAYFNLDLATMRGYRLGEAKNRLLIALALYKILRLLDGNLRLRTACDFDALSLTVTRPDDLDLSNRADLLAEIERKMPELIRACEFGDDPVTRLIAPTKGAKTTSKDENKNAEQSVTNDDAPEEETPISDDDEDEDA